MRNGLRNGSDILIENEKYIEKKINALSVYNVYWCMYELRLRSQLPTDIILKDDSFCKLRLIRILKQRRYSTRSLNIFLEVSAENSIPLSYVKWFYDDIRAALWLKMVLRNTINSSESIITESDISIFIHDVIFNKKLLILNRKIVEKNSDSQVAFKKIALEKLKDAYLLSKVKSKDIQWLTNKNNGSAKTNYTYQYMNKIHDLNQLKINKENNKIKKDKKNKENKGNIINNEERKIAINKSKYRQALICSDIIKFKATDTAMRLCHMLASLDYWMFDTYWPYQESHIVGKEKADNRELFISNMEDVWNSKQKRDRDKIKKNQGIDLTSDNKKNLKYLAKVYGKTQREVLNDLVESAYSQTPKQEIKLTSSLPYQDAFFDKIPLEQPSSLPSEDSEEEVVSEDTLLTKKKQELNSEYDANSANQSAYDNEEVLAESVTPKQEVDPPLQTFAPKGSYEKQAGETADTNTDNYHQL